jgi:hypothetical protein
MIADLRLLTVDFRKTKFENRQPAVEFRFSSFGIEPFESSGNGRLKEVLWLRQSEFVRF